MNVRYFVVNLIGRLNKYFYSGRFLALIFNRDGGWDAHMHYREVTYINKVDCASAFLVSGIDALLLGVQSGMAWQEGGVDVDHSSVPSVQSVRKFSEVFEIVFKFFTKHTVKIY